MTLTDGEKRREGVGKKEEEREGELGEGGKTVIGVEARKRIKTCFIHSAICLIAVGHSGNQRAAEKPSDVAVHLQLGIP